MSEKPSRVTTDIDFGRDGRQVSFLHVPYSRNEAAWGTLLVPLTVLRNGPGPTVLMTGGNHGDEFEGQVALSKLARELEPGDIRGCVIIMPLLNLPAARAGQRLSPVDGRNMNRVFPGRRDGSITEVIAHYVVSELLPLADVVVDIHSGGRSMSLLPCGVIHDLPDRAQMARCMDLLLAFGAPAGLVITELDSEGMLDTAVEAAGKAFLSTELGGGGMLSPATMAIADRGVRNVLRALDVLDGEVVSRESLGLEPTRLIQVPDADCYVMAMAAGVYEPFVEIGEDIAAGQDLGQIHFLEEPHREPQVVTGRRAGTLICRRIPGQVEPGDNVAVLAGDYVPGA